MAQRMAGKRVALAGPRKADEMALLVAKMGGEPVQRPAQGTVFLDDIELRNAVVAWVKHPPDWNIFTTGMGLNALFDMAEDMGVAEQIIELLQGSNIAARGYKTVNELKKRGFTPDVRDEDGSLDGLTRAFAPYDLKGKEVLLQLHGDPAPRLVKWLDEQGAVTRQVLPYKHIPPEEANLQALLADIVSRSVDAVTFTSGPQIRFLCQYAREQNRMEDLLEAFRQDVIAVSVGKVTAQSILEEGIERIVFPVEERMGAMMVELGKYFEHRGSAHGFGLEVVNGH
ncbi:uroporphyrinogen-III synthase [Paenibacillus brasilensis]|uniref:Uroporphyrinogen-III synthase n=1 Tax=Paenibacillus brasilensis TaxID=128574 RepID=A0ABU0KXK4_9BACL|nr:uroporphyrinogen-III synthase [Paenibacillus brasilensis]MDQ0494180.1 uroporphyrinogen-III synthase [Paenibacillus brasilensis]